MARILAQVGLQADRPVIQAPTIAVLWPENVGCWRVWCSVQTQWRVGFAGATGLDYAAVWAVLDKTGPRQRRMRREWFEHIQSMESAAMDAWAERREREKRKTP